MTETIKTHTPDTVPTSPDTKRGVFALLSSVGTRLRGLVSATPKKHEVETEKAEGVPTWSITMSGLVDRKKPIDVTITRVQNDRGLIIGCSSGFVSKTILFRSSEEAREIQEGLSQLSDAEKATLAANLGFTEMDDSRIDHPNGAGIHMQEALVKACAPQSAE